MLNEEDVEKANIHTKFWWNGLKKRGNLKYLGILGNIILKRILDKHFI
jgi:hypothetical protein